MVEAITIPTPDGVTLEGEVASPPASPRAGMVLRHPHPQYGGSMRSIVIGTLFSGLPPIGVACLRFNFRGVEGSTGQYDEGRGERTDARTAVGALSDVMPAGAPLILAGWSFGADVALAVRDERVAAWLAIAPPLSVVDDVEITGKDPRPKLLALAVHDEVRDPAEVAAVARGWSATKVEVVPGASHFFVGRTDRLLEIAAAFVESLLNR